MIPLVPLIAGLTLLFLSVFLTHYIRLWALKKQILDHPNQRSSHSISTPRGGGLAFVVLFYLALLCLMLMHFLHFNIFLAFLGGIPIAIVGYCDDLSSVKPRWRACIQIASAIWGTSWLSGTPAFYFGHIIWHAPILFFMFAVFSIVWFVNLYNFMDGIDGLAGVEALFISGLIGSFLWIVGFTDIALVCFALFLSVAGFLVWNWPNANIFMGDVGSGFLGYVFAILMWITNTHQQIPFPIWWILLAFFIADASYTLIYRIFQKKKLSEAHREHAYQRLTQAGFTHKQVTLGVLCINMIILLPAAILYFNVSDTNIFLLLASLVIMGWLAWFWILKRYP